MTTAAMSPSYTPTGDSRHLAGYGIGVPVGESSRAYSPTHPPPQSAASNISNTNGDYAYNTYIEAQPRYQSMRAKGTPDRQSIVRQSSYGEFALDQQPPSAGVDVDYAAAQRQHVAVAGSDGLEGLPSPYDRPLSGGSGRPGSSSGRRQYSPSPYRQESPRHTKTDSGVFTDIRSAAATPVELSEGPTPPSGMQTPLLQNGVPKHPSISPIANGGGAVPPRHAAPVIPASAAPSYKPASIPISQSTRAVAQQPTYITPPSSPTPIAVNPVYSYAADVNPAARFAAQQAFRPQPARFNPNDGREICVECAMRDQDMADVDVTSPGIWERESDVHYHDLCRQELEEAEERARARASNSSSESQPIIVRPVDPNRPRAKGNRLTEPNIKLWLTMNPREPQARQQTIDLYIKTQTALLEAEALARARAIQESRALETKLKDTYENLRRSTYDMPTGSSAVDESGIRLKPSSSSRRSVSGPAPISIGSIVVDPATHHARNVSSGRDVTLLENGLIVEEVDVRKEERERRREERRERSRNRKTSRGSGGDRNGEVVSMYSTHSPVPYQTDSGFYTSASNGSAAMLARENRPMSLSGSSMRATSMLSAGQPLTPPPGSASYAGSTRPPNTRVQSQVSLLDSQSISSASLNANRRSRFFAFRNWSEAWKSRESFAPSGVLSINGSMMDMHLALDREQEKMRMRPPTMDLGSLSQPMIPRHGEGMPRRASVSVDRNVAETDRDRPKKKKGFARIWGVVTGGRKKQKLEEPRARGREVVQLDRPEERDDTPLAPPPPLSYLVNRSPRERTMSSPSRRQSVASSGVLQPSNTLPTPTSIRSTWIEDGSRQIGAPLTAHTEESASNVNGLLDQPTVTEPTDTDLLRPIQPMMSEPDMRQRSQQDAQMLSLADVHLQLAASRQSNARPISMYSLHKSLPPLPPNEEPANSNGTTGPGSGSMPTPIDMPRPKTMFDANPQPLADSPEELAQPNPPFRHEGRRQSFGGSSSRPDLTQPGMNANLGVGTFPMNYTRPQQPCMQLDGYESYSPYAEMGAMQPPSSRSISRLDTAMNEKQIGKRTSRFGLGSLFGKKVHNAPARPMTTHGGPMDVRLSVAASNLAPAPGPPTSESDPSNEFGGPGNTSSRSRHGNGNGFGSVNGQSRMSVASRKAIEELVDQDPKFVAYRYPSVDHNIAIMR